MSAAPALRIADGAGADRRVTSLVAALASVIARPLDHLDRSAIRVPGLTTEALSRIGAHPAFRIPVNRAVSRELRLGDIDLGGDVVARLRASPSTRLAALLVSHPMARLQDAATLVAAAVLHRRVVGLVLRSDRERVRAVLGETAFRVAVQEAPLLHAPLAELDAEPGAFAGPAEAPGGLTSRDEVVAVGRGVLGRFVATTEPGLHRLFEARWPSGQVPPLAPPEGNGALSPVACEHVLRLLRRRMDPWAAIIG